MELRAHKDSQQGMHGYVEHLTALDIYYISIGHEEKENCSAYHRYHEAVQESSSKGFKTKVVSTGLWIALVLDKMTRGEYIWS